MHSSHNGISAKYHALVESEYSYIIWCVMIHTIKRYMQNFTIQIHLLHFSWKYDFIIPVKTTTRISSKLFRGQMSNLNC